MGSLLKQYGWYAATLAVLTLGEYLMVSITNVNTYVCQFQSSTDVICYDHDGAIFRLFKRAPDKFTVILPVKTKKP